jgi:amino-acid N-acetyltransferase
VVGAEGIEVYDGSGLLRSAVVAEAYRGRGIGDRLTVDRLSWARRQGLHEVWLLTTTAADWWPRFGFSVAVRREAPDALQASPEFAGACPASAVAMRLALTT